jgi:hypothetical protein
MCDFGGFSWCPATLDDMPVDLSTDMEGGSDAKEEELIDIDHKGAIEAIGTTSRSLERKSRRTG